MGALRAERLVLALGRAAHDQALLAVELGAADRDRVGRAEVDGAVGVGFSAWPSLDSVEQAATPRPGGPGEGGAFQHGAAGG